MKTKIMSIFTRTPLHVGCGSSVGAVDQPVVRERHTGYPIIPGSTIKGVLADLWLKRNADGSIFYKETKKTVKGEDGTEHEKTIYESVRDEEGIKILGSTDNKNASAGSLLIGEGKLLAFPVRSAKGCWAWLTCPLAIARFARDSGAAIENPEVKGNDFLVSDKLKLDDSVVFEEYPLKVVGTVPEDVKNAFTELCEDPVWAGNLANHLAVVSDDLFTYFAKNACEIANHNRINDETGVVDDGALFSQENVPSETLFYVVFTSADAGDFSKAKAKLQSVGNVLQIGADMTTGLGWCSVGFND